MTAANAARRASAIASTSSRRAFTASTASLQVSASSAPQGPAPTPDQQTISGLPSYSTVYPPPPRTTTVPTALRPIPRVERTHNVLVGRIQLRSYDDHVHSLDAFVAFAQRAAHALGIPCSGAKFLPTRTTVITTIRGPFAHAKSKENFWRRTHKRSLAVYDAHEDVVSAWIEYLESRMMAGVGLRSERIRRLPLGFAEGAVERALMAGDARRKAAENAASAPAAVEAKPEPSMPALETSNEAAAVAAPLSAAPADEPEVTADEAPAKASDTALEDVPSTPDVEPRSVKPPSPSSSSEPSPSSTSSEPSDSLSDLESDLDAIEKEVLSEGVDADVYATLEPDFPSMDAEDRDFDIDLSPAPVQAAPEAVDERAATMDELRPLIPRAAEAVPDAKDVAARHSAEGPDEATTADGAAIEVVKEGEGDVLAEAERSETPPVVEASTKR